MRNRLLNVFLPACVSLTVEWLVDEKNLAVPVCNLPVHVHHFHQRQVYWPPPLLLLLLLRSGRSSGGGGRRRRLRLRAPHSRTTWRCLLTTCPERSPDPTCCTSNCNRVGGGRRLRQVTFRSPYQSAPSPLLRQLQHPFLLLLLLLFLSLFLFQKKLNSSQVKSSQVNTHTSGLYIEKCFTTKTAALRYTLNALNTTTLQLEVKTFAFALALAFASPRI